MIEDKILESIDRVNDPHMPLSFVEMEMIYNVAVDDGHATVTMTYPCMGCPAYGMIDNDIKEATLAVDEINSVDIDVTWEPVWSKDMLSDEARLKLESSGIAV